MPRHRKVKALDFDEEYDDYYGNYDDDEDFDEEAFESQYLSSGIDLNTSESSQSNSASKINKNRQTIIDEVNRADTIDCDNSNSTKLVQEQNFALKSKLNDKDIKDSNKTLNHTAAGFNENCIINSLSSELTKLAAQHLDKHQWQLPLLDMDKKFRDSTYYKHYTASYISSLRSKLGHFLADRQLIDNPMRYHIQRELDNYSKYSRMFELLTNYYQSLGSNFFSFATPSPDETIVIGCRLGTKVKKPVANKNQSDKGDAQHKTARFEYSGKSNPQPSSSKSNKQAGKIHSESQKGRSKDLTIEENYTAEQLDKLAKDYQESIKLDANKTTNKSSIKITTSIKSKPKAASATATTNTTNEGHGQAVRAISNSTRTAPTVKPKQLTTLVEKRHNLKQQLKRSAELSAQDKETLAKQSLQTLKEYNELVKNSRPRINLVVVGHVDAGKSTLVGHLLHKLGQISGKQMHRYEVDSQRSGKASFKFAWALDETTEERERGVTIDIALTQFQTANRDIVLLDAPGHVDFIPAVISGAAQADAALLVVDATRGEFETGFNSGGQTREHTFLVRSLGVKSIIVVVNKMDNVDWDWNRFVDIIDQLKPFLKQAGFNLKDDVQFLTCSGLTGDNLVERRIDKAKKESSHPQLEGGGGNWNAVPSLIEAIDKMKPPERMVDKPTRVCITDVFKGMSGGVFLGGKVVSGKIEAKQKLILLPPNEACEIKQVEVRESKANRAFAGDIVTVVGLGIDLNKYYRGCILCDQLIPCNVTNRFQARIIMFQSINTILIKGTPVEVHINGTYESGVVRRLISLLNKNTGELIQNKPRCVAKNSSAVIQLRLERVVCCESYEDNKDLGRFMMRSYGKTIAAGLITKIKSAKVIKDGTKLKSKR